MPAQDFEFRIQPRVLPPVYAEGAAPSYAREPRGSDVNWGAVAAALLVAVAIVLAGLLWKGTTRWGDCDVNCATLWTTLWQHETNRHKTSVTANTEIAGINAKVGIAQAQAAQNIAASLPVIAPVAAIAAPTSGEVVLAGGYGHHRPLHGGYGRVPSPRDIYNMVPHRRARVCVPCVPGYVQAPDCTCSRTVWRPGPSSSPSY